MSSVKFILFLLVIVAYSGFLPLVASLDFTASKWIWTSDYSASTGSAPTGDRAFRRTVVTPTGKTARYIDIIITVDNFYTLYVNGVALGGRTSSNDWTVAGRFCVSARSDNNVIAVKGSNEYGPAGVLAAFQIVYTDGTTSSPFVSDGNWKSSLAVPVGFEQPTYNDAAWSLAVISGNFNVYPYGAPIPIPAQSPCAGSGGGGGGGGGGGHLNDSAVIEF